MYHTDFVFHFLTEIQYFDKYFEIKQFLFCFIIYHLCFYFVMKYNYNEQN